MLRAFLIEPASSRGPYDDETTVTQGVVGYNLRHNESRQPVASAFAPSALVAPLVPDRLSLRLLNPLRHAGKGLYLEFPP